MASEKAPAPDTRFTCTWSVRCPHTLVSTALTRSVPVDEPSSLPVAGSSRRSVNRALRR